MSWKTAEPPWTLGGKYNKTSYNEGDKITTKANSVFVPATENAPGGTPVTTAHAPCGYWFSIPNVSFNSLNVLGVEVAFCSSGSIVIGPGCEDGTCAIAYTSQGMSVDEEQTLSVTAPADKCTYFWAITAGGGSLSAASGNSVTYTAPSSNAGCANNATVTLTTLGNVCDSLSIAISSAGWSNCDEAIIYNCVTDVPFSSLWKCCFWEFDCYGVRATATCDNSWSYCDRCAPGTSGVDGMRSDVSSTQQGAIDHCALSYKGGTTDQRTAGDIANGCCPPQLL